MILDNYWKCMAAQSDGNTVETRRTEIYVKSMDGGVYSFTTYGPYAGGADRSFYNFLNGMKTCVGGSNTPVQHDDYRLGLIYAALNNYETSISAVNDGNKLKIVILIAGVNTYSGAITISEVGVYHTFLTGPLSGASNIDVMFVREILENPITVAPNQGFFLSFEWVQM
jgi:hypothetical protein